MCGIAGFKGRWNPQALAAMGSRLAHRGPDDAGEFYDPDARIGLVHTRLSIIGVTTGHQPLGNLDGSIQVVFNGEIYNYRQLRSELESKGYRFRTESDTEVIPYLYEEMGVRFVNRLRGMFAIALWDAREQRLLVIRDRFGIKPVYYRNLDQGLIFASEVKALLAVDPVSDIDPQAMRWFLAFRYVPEERTLFSGIRKLEPGCYLEVSPNGIRTERYWTLVPKHNLSGRSQASIAEELKARLSDAVNVRLMSEVPLGAFLSGGLDSSFIVGLMSGMIQEPVRSFSFGVGEGWHNESEFAAIAADRFGTQHYKLGGNCNDPETLERAVWFLDEPLADTAVIPTYLLSELTRQHVTVVLTGEGADELLGGYDKYKALSVVAKLKRLSWLAMAGRPVSQFFSLSGLERALDSVALAGDFPAAYMALVSVFSPNELDSLLTPELLEMFRDTEPPEAVIRRALADLQELNIMDQLMHIDVATWLPNDVLLKADKMSMAHALEARVPFLDHEFAEFAASIPSSIKLRRMREKHILRLAMRGLVPEQIVRRRKHGFTVSLKPWQSSEGSSGLLETVLSSERLRARGWFRPEAVAALLRKPLDDGFVRRQVFTVLMAEEWSRIFLDGAGRRFAQGF